MSMFDAARALDKVVEKLEDIRDLVDQGVRAHVGSAVAAPPFLRFGMATVPLSTAQTLFTLEPPSGHAGVVTALATCADPWDDGTGTFGIVMAVMLGGRPFDDLARMDSPWGTIGEREPIWIPFNSKEPFSIVARNLNAVSAIEASAQISGFWYSVRQGIPPQYSGFRGR